jgi:Family of unknown function (DUF6516)
MSCTVSSVFPTSLNSVQVDNWAPELLPQKPDSLTLSTGDIVKLKRDTAIDALLDLHGSIIDQGAGYWIKLEAWRVDACLSVPHGIRYSLTLHEPHGTRILGYDNAHGVKPPSKFKYAGRILSHDHKHRHVSDKGVHYEFKDAQALINDFFRDVDSVLLGVKKK